jgi:hypothetical protein
VNRWTIPLRFVKRTPAEAGVQPDHETGYFTAYSAGRYVGFEIWTSNGVVDVQMTATQALRLGRLIPRFLAQRGQMAGVYLTIHDDAKVMIIETESLH